MNVPPEISIVVPAFNEAKLLAGSLAAIRQAAGAFDDAGVSWELVVCDNNSTDATGTIAREAGARVVFEPVNQIGRARNAGAAAAQGRWLLFVDADSQPSRGLLADVAAVLRRDDVVLAGATLRLDEAPRAARWAVSAWNASSRLFGWVAGSFILVRADDFRAIGGFDLSFYAGEELDLARRLARLGRRNRRRTVILHRHPLLTSARKVHLYGPRDFARFFARGLVRPRGTLASREACALWYDGRR